VIVAGAVLCFTPLAAVGVGIVIGVGVATGAGLATGTLDPRQIAFSGVLGGIAGGVGASGLDALASVRAGLGMGVTGELGQELIHGGGIDLQSIAVNGAVGALTGGIGFRMSSATATSAARVAGVGAVSDGSGSIVRQALTGDHTIDVGRVAFDAAGGAGSSVASHYFGAGQLDPLSGHPRWPATPERQALPRGPAPQLVTVHRRISEAVELQIQHETGLILRGRHAETSRAEVARDSLTAHTSTGPDSVAIERVGD
jgi:hypothetical protein